MKKIMKNDKCSAVWSRYGHYEMTYTYVHLLSYSSETESVEKKAFPWNFPTFT
jgi:hypothetical protein